MTVYIVTYGEYDDYRIETVFSTLEDARKYVDQAGARSDYDPDQYHIEPWTVDYHKDMIGETS